MDVILYSTGCPKCEVIKKKLKNKAVTYTENNSVDEMLALGIQHVPVLSVDGELMSFPVAAKWIDDECEVQ